MRKLNYWFRYLFSCRKKRLLLKYNGSEMKSAGIPINIECCTLKKVRKTLRGLYDAKNISAKLVENGDIRVIHKNDELGFSFSFHFKLSYFREKAYCWGCDKNIDSKRLVAAFYYSGYNSKDGHLYIHSQAMISFLTEEDDILRFPLRMEIDYDISTSTCKASAQKSENIMK